jgi:Domain of unknown function (DUF4406)
VSDTRYYLTGPTTGLPNNNIASFDEAYGTLLRKGCNLQNPIKYLSNNAQRINTLLDADAVIVLPAWGRDDIAKGEILVATLLGKPVYAYHQYRPEILEKLNNIKIVTRAEVLA